MLPICFLGHHRHPPAPKHSSRLLLALAIVDDLPEAALEQVGQRFLAMIHQDSIKTPIKTSRNYTIIYVICGSLWKWWSLNPLVFVLMNYQIIIFPSIFFPWCHFMIFQDILSTVYPIFRQIYDSNLHVFCHKGSKSFQNIAFDSVFVMFPVKHTVIYTFFAITSVQNTCFCSVFNALASKNPAKSCYVQCFFSFLAVFSIAGKLPKWPKIPFQYPLALRHPKILEKCRKHHRILVSVRNRFWPPPPAKADIATAILTNVIEHLVLLFCPPISTPSPPKRCGRISRYFEYRVPHFQTDLWQDAWPGPSLPGACVVAPQRAMCSSGARWAEGHGSQGGPEGAEHLEKSWSWNTHVVKHM